LDNTEGFELEPRQPEHLPESIVDSNGNPISKDEVSWFLNSYRHKSLKDDTNSNLMQHVQAALKEHNIE
jgi:hypothetical protein